jgi:hypothetical protein
MGKILRGLNSECHNLEIVLAPGPKVEALSGKNPRIPRIAAAGTGRDHCLLPASQPRICNARLILRPLRVPPF